MAGNLKGGAQAAKTNKELYGEDFYSRIGKLGGKAPSKTPKGFAANKDFARIAGKLGGAKSKRVKGDNRESVDKDDTE